MTISILCDKGHFFHLSTDFATGIMNCECTATHENEAYTDLRSEAQVDRVWSREAEQQADPVT